MARARELQQAGKFQAAIEVLTAMLQKFKPEEPFLQESSPELRRHISELEAAYWSAKTLLATGGASAGEAPREKWELPEK